MSLSDKIRRTAFTLAVGSIGAVVGYVGNDVADFVGEMRRKSAAEEQDHREYMERIKHQYVPPLSNYRQPELDLSFHCIGTSCAM